jgi:hypothetical protein
MRRVVKGVYNVAEAFARAGCETAVYFFGVISCPVVIYNFMCIFLHGLSNDLMTVTIYSCYIYYPGIP